MKVAIVGLGYVGLPLAVQFACSNVNVIGLDVDKTKVDLINDGQSRERISIWLSRRNVKIRVTIKAK